MKGPHEVTRQFEAAVAAYTGARFAVAVNSCTAALTLAIAYQRTSHPRYEPKYPDEVMARSCVEIPRRTYLSVPMSIIHAGYIPTFRDEDWLGAYELKFDDMVPHSVWDSARWFTAHLFHKIRKRAPETRPMICVSFHASKTLGLEQGGAILHDSPDADAWLRRARFDGRAEGVAPIDDRIDMIGYHCYMNPSTAAQGVLRMHSMRYENDPLPNDDYPDLSRMEVFR